MMMDDQEDFNLGFTVNKRGEAKKVELTKTAIKDIQNISQNHFFDNQFNSHLDHQNLATPSMINLRISKTVDFDHYLLKNKYKNDREKVFEVLRELLEERGYADYNKVNDKLEEQSIIVMRIIEKVEGHLNTFRIEDQFSDAKLYVKEGIVWVGMICAVRVKYFDGMYRLTKADDIIDLSVQIERKTARLRADKAVHRMMILRGPFRPKFQNEDKGIRLVSQQIKKLRKQNIIINSLIVLGPILNKQHISIKQFKLQKTYEEQYEWIIKKLLAELKEIPHQIKLYILPSLQDITSIYPIPQPCYEPISSDFEHVRFLSNPTTLEMDQPIGIKVSFVNYDMIEYINKMQGGKAIKQIAIEEFTSYLKQPFFMTNTLTKEEPFDETNFGQLYNHGDFGDFIITSSNRHEPLFRKISTSNSKPSKAIINVGSLGIQSHATGDYYISVLSVYEGEGDIMERTKLDFITMKM